MIKILACDCYLDELQERFEETGTRFGRVFCKCEDDHLHCKDYLVSICKKCKYNLPPCASEILQNQLVTCRFKRLDQFETCSYCINLQYMLNFSAYKLFFKKKKIVSFNFGIKLLTDFLSKKLLVDPFLYLISLLKRLK